MKGRLQSDQPQIEFSGYHEEVLRLVKKKYIQNKTVLDIGCGFGWFEETFVKFKPKKMVGIEPSSECLSIARRVNNPLCVFKKGGAPKLAFPDNSFDTVVAWEVLEHIPKDTEQLLLSEISRVLKPKGNFFLSTPYRHLLSNALDPAWWFIGHRHYSKNKLRSLCQKNNLSIVRMYTRGKVFVLLSSLNMYISKWILGRDRILNDFFRKKSQIEYKKSGYVTVILQATKD